MPVQKKSLAKSPKTTKTVKAGKLKSSASKGSKVENLIIRAPGGRPGGYVE